LGALIAERGMSLLFGGGNVGLMGETARAVRAGGAPVLGVLPAFLRYLEPPMTNGEELEITPDLQQRKARMLALADAFVILPGGFGTLDEFFEVLTSAQLDVFKKPIVVVNINGYFDLLRDLLAHIVRSGFARENSAALCRFVATPEEAMDAISSFVQP
jgi:uncharacterized protein (TIGR00730 family)